MKERFSVYWQQVRKLWTSLSVVKRIVLVAATLGVVAAVLLVSTYTSRETYAYLFTELSPEDAAAITAKLKELKIPYKVEASGTAIQVAEERVHEVRLDLAGLGLPKGGGVGFEIFDKTHLGATEFEQRINLRRALEGELSRTIGTIASVQTARVHLVLPERSVFAIANQQASASVVLKLRPGRSFGKGEVASVVHLVSTAVPGLGPERVSVVSADGLMLHRPKSDTRPNGVGGADDEGLEVEHQLVTQLEERARGLLERVVGAGHADVRIGITLDTSTRERTEEHYEPAKTALRSEQKTEERSASEPERVAGVPGSGTNLPDGQSDTAAAASSAGTGVLRTNSTRNWEIDRITEKTATPPGRIARLTVAALVDGSYKDTGGTREFVVRDRAELDRMAELVKGAVGFQAERGDFLQVECAPFAGMGEETERPTPTTQPPSRRFVQYGIYGACGAVAVALAVAFAVVSAKRRKRAAEQRRLELEASAQPGALTDATDSAQLLTAAPKDPAEIRAEALQIATNDPATAAVILRGWLNAPAV